MLKCEFIDRKCKHKKHMKKKIILRDGKERKEGYFYCNSLDAYCGCLEKAYGRADDYFGGYENENEKD